MSLSGDIKLDLVFKDLLGKLSLKTTNLPTTESVFSVKNYYSDFIWIDSENLKRINNLLTVEISDFSTYNFSSPTNFYIIKNDQNYSLSNTQPDNHCGHFELVLDYRLTPEMRVNYGPYNLAPVYYFDLTSKNLQNYIPNYFGTKFGVSLYTKSSNGVRQLLSDIYTYIIKDGYVLFYSSSNNSPPPPHDLHISFYAYKGRFGLSSFSPQSSSRISVLTGSLNNTSSNNSNSQVVNDPVFRIASSSIDTDTGGVELKLNSSNIIFEFSYASASKSGLLRKEDWDTFSKKLGVDDFSNLRPNQIVYVSNINDRVIFGGLNYSDFPVANSVVIRDANGYIFVPNAPTNNLHAVNKSYVDSFITSPIEFAEDAMKAATTANLANNYFEEVIGGIVIDGVPINLNDLVLVKDQDSNSTYSNGIYKCVYANDLTETYKLVISDKYRVDNNTLKVNLVFYVQSGDINAGRYFRVSKISPVTFSLFFSALQFTANLPLDIQGNTIRLNYDSNDFSLNGNNLSLTQYFSSNQSFNGDNNPFFSITVNRKGIITSINSVSATKIPRLDSEYINSLSSDYNGFLFHSSYRSNIVNINRSKLLKLKNPNILEDASFYKIIVSDKYFADAGSSTRSNGVEAHVVENSTFNINGSVSYNVCRIDCSLYNAGGSGNVITINLTYFESSEYGGSGNGRFFLYYFYNLNQKNVEVILPIIENRNLDINLIGRVYRFCRGNGNENVSLKIVAETGNTINGYNVLVLNREYEVYELMAVNSTTWVIMNVI